MKNLALYGLGGLTAVILLAAVAKRHPKGRKFLTAAVPNGLLPRSPVLYVSNSADTPAGIAGRFGISAPVLIAANPQFGKLGMGGAVNKPGTMVKLPAGVKDGGARIHATGATR
jgi:LysM repeat protein